ncbi:hypothetical protein EJB05_09785, partial [Eragrostis curvula]
MSNPGGFTASRFEEMDLSGKHFMFLLEFHENVSQARLEVMRFEVMDLSGKQSMFLLEFDENLSPQCQKREEAARRRNRTKMGAAAQNSLARPAS